MQTEWFENEDDLNLKYIFFCKNIRSFNTFHTQLKEFYYDNEFCCEVFSEFMMQIYHCSQSNFTEFEWRYLQNSHKNLKFFDLIEILHYQN